MPATETFDPAFEEQFRESRIRALAELNASIPHFGLAAAMVLLFSVWDYFVDPAAWSTALMVRLAAIAVILSTGIIQRRTARISWAPVLAKVRFAGSVLAVAGANAVVHNGFVVGLAGLVAVFLGGPYIVLDRRDYLATTLVPLGAVAAILYAEHLDRFTVINATVFLALTLIVGLMLARVFESTNRRAFALGQALMREARTDALTGLPNRRAMEESAAIELKRHARSGQPLTLIVCDVDHFKRINDDHGHGTGDRAIRAVGDTLRAEARATDVLGRWGGEEFLLLLPDTTERDGTRLAERMRLAVSRAAMPAATPFSLTISLGVSEVPVDRDKPDAAVFERALKAADDALYRAKAEGRDRVFGASVSI